MIKLQDFAHQKGVTDRTVQKHLKKHEKELKDHFQRKGPNGTWIDDFACEFLSDLMKTNAVAVSDVALLEKNKELEKENQALMRKVQEYAEKIAVLYEERAENAQKIALAEVNQLLLEDKNDEIEVLKRELKAAQENVGDKQSELDKFEKTIFGLYRKKR